MHTKEHKISERKWHPAQQKKKALEVRKKGNLDFKLCSIPGGSQRVTNV